MNPTFLIQGAIFTAFPLGHASSLCGGAVYVLGRRQPDGSVSVLYVGQTGELDGYLGPCHKKWDRAWQLGMNVLLVHWRSDETQRLNLETILRHQFRPRLNEQLQPSPRGRIAKALATPPQPTPFNAMVGFPPAPLGFAVNAMLSPPTSPRPDQE